MVPWAVTPLSDSVPCCRWPCSSATWWSNEPERRQEPGGAAGVVAVGDAEKLPSASFQGARCLFLFQMEAPPGSQTPCFGSRDSGSGGDGGTWSFSWFLLKQEKGLPCLSFGVFVHGLDAILNKGSVCTIYMCMYSVQKNRYLYLYYIRRIYVDIDIYVYICIKSSDEVKGRVVLFGG